MPRDPALPFAPEPLVDFLDQMVAEMPRLLQLAFPIGLRLLEYGTWLWGFSWHRFSGLTLSARQRYVQSWVHAPWMLRRDLIKGVKGLMLFAYYSDPVVAKFVGYLPDEHAERVTAERLKRYGHTL